MKHKEPAENFFDSVSGFYDSMISFDKALPRRMKMLEKFVEPGMRTACDLGCGSGLDSVALAQNGLNVTAFDLSAGMIKKAKMNAERTGVTVKFIRSPLESINNSFFGKFDLVVSLGNTLANLNYGQLRSALKSSYNLLKTGGVLVLQILNYEMIKKDNKRIIKVSKEKDKYIIRFSDIFPSGMNFNILRVDPFPDGRYEIYTTTVYPHTNERFQSLLKKIGFKKVRFYGGLDKSRFVKFRSGDLAVTARKTNLKGK